MPILTPIEAYSLCQNKIIQNGYKQFFRTFLPIASKNIFLNNKTFQAYDQFSKLFVSNYCYINEYFDLDMPNLKSISTDNYYDFFLNIIQTQYKGKNDDHPCSLSNGFDALNVPISTIDFSVFTSSISYAVISLKNNMDRQESIVLDIIILILIASGHILTLSVSNLIEFSTVKSLVKTSIFSECHIFREEEKDFDISFLNNITDTYVYLYAFQCNKINPSQVNSPFFHFFFISAEFQKVFNKYDKKPFKEVDEMYPQNEDRFLINKIAIVIYNCQDFKSYDLKNCWIPSDVSAFKRVFIDASDFMDWYGQRIKYYKDLSSKKIIGYLDFNEMHYMKIDHHIKNPLYTMNIPRDTVKIINYVIKHLTSPQIFNEIKSKFSDVDKFIEEKVHYAFHKIYKYWCSYSDPIIAYPTQVFTVNHAIDYLANSISG